METSKAYLEAKYKMVVWDIRIFKYQEIYFSIQVYFVNAYLEAKYNMVVWDIRISKQKIYFSIQVYFVNKCLYNTTIQNFTVSKKERLSIFLKT